MDGLENYDLENVSEEELQSLQRADAVMKHTAQIREELRKANKINV